MANLTIKFLNEAEAEEYVRKSWNTRWDGWDLVTWVRNPKGYVMSNGAFKRGQKPGRGWGVEYRVSPDKNGKWKVKVVSS